MNSTSQSNSRMPPMINPIPSALNNPRTGFFASMMSKPGSNSSSTQKGAFMQNIQQSCDSRAKINALLHPNQTPAQNNPLRLQPTDSTSTSQNIPSSNKQNSINQNPFSFLQSQVQRTDQRTTAVPQRPAVPALNLTTAEQMSRQQHEMMHNQIQQTQHVQAKQVCNAQNSMGTPQFQQDKQQIQCNTPGQSWNSNAGMTAPNSNMVPSQTPAQTQYQHNQQLFGQSQQQANYQPQGNLPNLSPEQIQLQQLQEAQPQQLQQLQQLQQMQYMQQMQQIQQVQQYQHQQNQQNQQRPQSFHPSVSLDDVATQLGSMLNQINILRSSQIFPLGVPSNSSNSPVLSSYNNNFLSPCTSSNSWSGNTPTSKCGNMAGEDIDKLTSMAHPTAYSHYIEEYKRKRIVISPNKFEEQTLKKKIKVVILEDGSERFKREQRKDNYLFSKISQRLAEEERSLPCYCEIVTLCADPPPQTFEICVPVKQSVTTSSLSSKVSSLLQSDYENKFKGLQLTNFNVEIDELYVPPKHTRNKAYANCRLIEQLQLRSGYTCTYTARSRDKIRDLRIRNQHGWVGWPGTIDICEVDFLGGPYIEASGLKVWERQPNPIKAKWIAGLRIGVVSQKYKRPNGEIDKELMMNQLLIQCRDLNIRFLQLDLEMMEWTFEANQQQSD